MYTPVMLFLFDHNYKDVDAGVFAKSLLGKNVSISTKFPPLGSLP